MRVSHQEYKAEARFNLFTQLQMLDHKYSWSEFLVFEFAKGLLDSQKLRSMNLVAYPQQHLSKDDQNHLQMKSTKSSYYFSKTIKLYFQLCYRSQNCKSKHLEYYLRKTWSHLIGHTLNYYHQLYLSFSMYYSSFMSDQ